MSFACRSTRSGSACEQIDSDVSTLIPKPLSDRRLWLSVARSYGRAVWARRRLPPGPLRDIGESERHNRKLLIDYSARYGPVFKGLMERRFLVCVVGHARSRQLLKQHSSSLQAVSIQLESLFPHGFMRGMQGKTHRDYRKALLCGLSEIDLESCTDTFEQIAARELENYASKADHNCMPSDWTGALSRIATSALVALFFGPEPGTVRHSNLVARYQQLGPNGVVWHITKRQHEAYQALLAELDSLGSDEGGLLGQLRAQGTVDPTLLGNLIYMVELGRYDLRGLLRWISCHAADQPAWLDDLASDLTAFEHPERQNAATEAFVLETLRMDQSERLMRNVLDDIVFERWLIPRGSLLRICMWEAHKEPSVFPQPFNFEPSRFSGPPPTDDSFSPFGLDHHHCPLSNPVIKISAAFLRALARGYKVRGRNAEPAVRGPYHWEPSAGFVVHLSSREKAGTE